MDRLFIKHPETGKKAEVSRTAYITAKWKDLREFGYSSLTRETVITELDNLLAGRPVTVIGEFMRGDLWLDEQETA